jgi:hypothetical protein
LRQQQEDKIQLSSTHQPTGEKKKFEMDTNSSPKFIAGTSFLEQTMGAITFEDRNAATHRRQEKDQPMVNLKYEGKKEVARGRHEERERIIRIRNAREKINLEDCEITVVQVAKI